MQDLQVRFLCLDGSRPAKDIGGRLQQLLLPLRDLVRMHVKLFSSLRQGLVTLDGRHPSLEPGCVIPSLLTVCHDLGCARLALIGLSEFARSLLLPCYHDLLSFLGNDHCLNR